MGERRKRPKMIDHECREHDRWELAAVAGDIPWPQVLQMVFGLLTTRKLKSVVWVCFEDGQEPPRTVHRAHMLAVGSPFKVLKRKVREMVVRWAR